MANPLIIGLTGLIGSGKSTVGALFAQYGATVHDTDLIAHRLTGEQGMALPQLAATFGPAIFNLDGSLNRNQLRELVFNDEFKRTQLEQILHPLIFKELVQQIKDSNNALYHIVMVPLLFRSPMFLHLTRRNLFIDCAYPLLIKRVRYRSNLSVSQITAILAQQVKRETQLALADDIIFNHGSVQDLEQQVYAYHKKYLFLGAKAEQEIKYFTAKIN
jgi:dephospho-CoA kinase